MKKIYLILVLFVVLLLVTACTSEKERYLTCSKIVKEDQIEIKREEYYVIEDYKVLNYTQILSSSFEDVYKDYINKYKNDLDNKYNELKDKKGIIYTSLIKDNSHILKIEVDYKKIVKDEFLEVDDLFLSYIGNMDSKISIVKVKENLEDEGYTCSYKKLNDEI